MVIHHHLKKKVSIVRTSGQTSILFLADGLVSVACLLAALLRFFALGAM
jgi:hypothetical protein